MTGGGKAGRDSAARQQVGLRALAPYLRAHRRPLIAVALLALVGAATALAQPLLTRQVLAAVSAGQPLAWPVIALIGLLVGDALIDGARGYLLQRTAEGLVLTSRIRLAGHLLRLPIAEYDHRRTGDLLSRVGADTTLLRAVVTSGLFESSSSVIIVLGAVVAMALLDPLLLAVTLVSVVLGLLAVVNTARRVRGLSEQAQARVGEMTAAVERALSAARTIRASRAEARETSAVADSAGSAYAAGIRAARLQSLISPAASVAVQGSFVLVLGVGGARVASGAITVADLVAFVLYLFLLVMPLAQGLRAYTTLQTGLGALQRIEDVLRLPAETAADRGTAPGEPTTADRGTAPGELVTAAPAVPARQHEPAGRHNGRDPVAREHGRALPVWIDPAAPAVEFAQVSFAYPDGTSVLHGVDFAVPRGTRTALVGPSGAGKSTILALIERFYDATCGAVRVGGVDVRDLPRDALRRQLGYVEQEAPVLAGTLRDNLLLTVPEATDAQLMAVIDAVNLGDVVERAPLGLDNQVGEAGVLLSGGERQRLAIARALLAAPPVLLLDEPTSNLDARNEAALRAAIDTVSHERTLVIVAHRLSTVVDADQIVVLDRGSVAAVGRHDELIEASDLYRELASHQLLVT